MVHHHRSRHTKAQPGVVPIEIELGAVQGWRVVGIGGVPPIQRRAGSPSDQARDHFIKFQLPEMWNWTQFDRFAGATGAVWARQMPDFPKCYSAEGSLPGLPASLSSYPSPADRVAAALILMRHGFLVIDGSPMPSVTRAGHHLSPDGTRFIEGEEGDGSHMYWPGNDASGVTIGAGYDMGNRAAEDVAEDLINVGVDPAAAARAAAGAGLLGAPAGDFAKEHRNDLKLSRIQQDEMLRVIVPRYEKFVLRNLALDLTGRLYQHEFDALVSLAYNINGYARHDAVKDVNRLDFVSAVPAWLTLIGGGAGIPDRRRREAMMFEDGIYICKALPPVR